MDDICRYLTNTFVPIVKKSQIILLSHFSKHPNLKITTSHPKQFNTKKTITYGIRNQSVSNQCLPIYPTNESCIFQILT
jgi:hypothetical protein